MPAFFLAWVAVFFAASRLAPAAPPAQVTYLTTGRPCCMAADPAGNVYVASSSQSGFLIAAGSFEGFLCSSCGPVGFATGLTVEKLDPDNNVVYQLHFSGAELATAVALDSQGDLLVASSLAGLAFVTKVSADGKTLLFTTFLGGLTGTTTINALAVDTGGNIFATGSTNAQDFPTTPGAFQRTGPAPPTVFPSGPTFAFLTRLSPTGAILASTYFGDNHAICIGTPSHCVFGAIAYTSAQAVAVASDGTVTIAGSTTADKLPTTPGVFQTAWKGVSDGFISRFSADLATLVWSTFLSGSGGNLQFTGDSIRSLAMAPDGGIIVAGTATSSDFPVTPGAFLTTFVGQPPSGGTAGIAFVAELNSTATSLVFSTFVGGSGSQLGSEDVRLFALVLDTQGNPWITGDAVSTDFPVPSGGLRLGDEFVAKLAPDGSKLLESQLLPDGSAGLAIAIDSAGNEILLGSGANQTASLLRIPPGGPQGTSILAIENAAGLSPSGQVAGGEVVSLFGTGLGPAAGVGAQLDSSGRLPAELAGVQVLFNGVAAPLLYAGASQVNAVAPFAAGQPPGFGGASTTVQVVTPEGSSPAVRLASVSADPAIFFLPAIDPAISARFQTLYAAALNQDGTLNSESNPAPQGSVVTVWVSGAGYFQPPLTDGTIVQPPLSTLQAGVTVLVGGAGETADVEYSGSAPGMAAGIMQVNFRVPPMGPNFGGAAEPVQVSVSQFPASLQPPGIGSGVAGPAVYIWIAPS